MSEATVPLETQSEAQIKRKATTNTLSRVFRYTAVRVVTLFITVVIAVYLTIMIANMGGYVDTIQRSQIQEQVSMQLALDPSFKALSGEEKQAYMAAQVSIREKRLGLDQPFMVRSLRYLSGALTLNLGRALQMSSDSGSKMVRNIILERLPATLVLFGTADVFLFIFTLLIALSLSRKYGSFLDKLFITLSPTSAAPGWFYGLLFCTGCLSVGWWMHHPLKINCCMP
jgi:peptide/nickel transport system permease protein